MTRTRLEVGNMYTPVKTKFHGREIHIHSTLAKFISYPLVVMVVGDVWMWLRVCGWWWILMGVDGG